VGDGLAAKDEELSSNVVELGTGEEEAALLSDELRESAEAAVPVAAETVHVKNPSCEGIEGGITAGGEEPTALSTSEQALNVTLEGVAASSAVESVGITDIDEFTPASDDDKVDVATPEQPQEQAAMPTSNESFARIGDEAAVGLPFGTDVTLEDNAAREETARATELEKEGGHTLPNT
ncbi:unnamed protein product, partial [Laminaria digitata]